MQAPLRRFPSKLCALLDLIEVLRMDGTTLRYPDINLMCRHSPQ